MMTGRFLAWAAKRGLDRLVVINKIDADNVDLEDLLDRIQQAFGKECLPLNLPAGKRSKVSDCTSVSRCSSPSIRRPPDSR